MGTYRLREASLRSITPRPRSVVVGDPERIVAAVDRSLFEGLSGHPAVIDAFPAAVEHVDASHLRWRNLEAKRLAYATAPEIYGLAREAQRILDLEGDLDLELRRGAENPANHLRSNPITVEVPLTSLALLDDPTMVALVGHELGHYCAHGPWSDAARIEIAARIAAQRSDAPADLAPTLARFILAKEITADRFALLASQDLVSIARLELALRTGLPATVLEWDAVAHIGESRALVQSLLTPNMPTALAAHVETSVRPWAAHLFFETKEFQQLTGIGPASRSLADIEPVVRTAVMTCDVSAHSVDERPTVLYECALAACVLLANVDEDFAEDEKLAIERAFGSLVADWRRYFDLDVARARLAETAGVVARGGPDWQRTVFILVSHVMAADGVLDEREVAFIQGLGDLLDCGPVYRFLLDAALEPVDVGAAPPPKTQALPARPQDVVDALDAFFQGVARRGRDTVTLRRLVRLAGGAERTPETIEAIGRAMRAHAIDSDGAIAEVPLDTLLELRSQSPAQRSSLPARPMEASRAQVSAAIRRLRDQLVSGDGRSPSVRARLRTGRVFDVATLGAVSVGLGERVLTSIRAGRIATLVEAAEIGTNKAAQTCGTELRALSREHLSRLEETGALDLHLGYPVLTGVIATDDARSKSYPVRGPLVLHPVDLTVEGAGARGFKLRPRKDESPIVNRALLRLVFAKKKFALDEVFADELDDLLADDSQGIEELIRKLEARGLSAKRGSAELLVFRDRPELAEERPFLEIEECALLGLFPQSSSDLLQDYDALQADLEDGTKELRALLASAETLLPAPLRRPDAVAQHAGRPVPVVAADPSQRDVVAACRAHPATVIDGPPGTGKSQVIVNLVADALRRGERVAVVCEKRAAIDVVFQRLDALGLAHGVALVHDVQDDRKPLFKIIAQRMESGHGGQANPVDDKADAIRQCEERLSGETRLLATPFGESGCTVAQLHALASAIDAPIVSEETRLEGLSRAQFERAQELCVQLSRLSSLWAAGSPWRAPPGQKARASFAKAAPGAVAELERNARAAASAAERFERLAASATCDLEGACRASRDIDATDDALRHPGAERDDAELAALLHAAEEEPGRVVALETAGRAWIGNESAIVRVGAPVLTPATGALVASLAVLRRWSGRLLRVFVWGWWKARSIFRRELSTFWSPATQTPFEAEVLEQVADRVSASGVWTTLGPSLERVGLEPQRDGDIGRTGARVRSVLRWAPVAREVAARAAALAGAGLRPPASASEIEPWARRIAAARELLQARAALVEASERVRSVLPWFPQLPTQADLLALADRARRDGPRLVQVDRWFEELQAVIPGGQQFADAVHEAIPSARDGALRLALTRAWARACVARADRELAGHEFLGSEASDGEIEEASAALGDLEGERRQDEVARVLHSLEYSRLLGTAPERAPGARRSDAQRARESMLREVRKQRRLWPLRRFVREFAGQGLLDFLPVWLLSPETMTVLFPRAPVFDLVIFDEASQCTVESSFPVLLRAKRVAIAGDEKQMPPTAFFSQGSSDEEPAVPEDGDARRAARDMFESESLLTLARERVHHAPLSWHYRCLHEPLIAFSNHALYDGGLMTIPSVNTATAPSPLRWVQVDGVSASDGGNTREAEKVVDVLHELLARDGAPTVGVVTFNIKHRKTVLDAIDDRGARDPAFQRAWATANAREHLDERPFIKNLESVQGDERDVIVFSLGHAPIEGRAVNGKPRRYVRAQFGPLGLRGGERRLNVAISRAKKECVVVSSFAPDLLSVASSKNEGPRLFKHFLEFAHYSSAGHRERAKHVLKTVAEWTSRRTDVEQPPRVPGGYLPVSAQIARAFEEHGVPYERDVGSSGFKVPIAVRDPRNDTRHALAIICDEDADDLTPFERFVHRPDMLRLRGWQVLRVTAAAWNRRRDDVLDRIFALVPGARGAVAPRTTDVARTEEATALQVGATVAPAADEAPVENEAIRAFTSSPILCTRVPDPAKRAKVVRAVSVLVPAGGVMKNTLFASQLQLPPFRVSGAVAELGEALNIDGYKVISYEQTDRRVILNLELLAQQFQIPRNA